MAIKPLPILLIAAGVVCIFVFRFGFTFLHDYEMKDDGEVTNDLMTNTPQTNKPTAMTVVIGGAVSGTTNTSVRAPGESDESEDDHNSTSKNTTQKSSLSLLSATFSNLNGTKNIVKWTHDQLKDYTSKQPRCKWLVSEPGKWVRLMDKAAIASHWSQAIPRLWGAFRWGFSGVRFLPSQCRYKWFTESTLTPCITKKKILFVGNSHIRRTMMTFCYLLKIPNCGELEHHKHLPHRFVHNATDFTLQYFFFSFKLNTTSVKYIVKDGPYDVVVTNQGAWDMLYN
eukprot:PhF_6_TR25102/c0_g1_i1/m.34487